MDDEIETFIKENVGQGKNKSTLYNEHPNYGARFEVIFHRLIEYKIVSVVGNNYINEGINFNKSIKDMESLENKSGDQIINVKENKGQIFQSRDEFSRDKTETIKQQKQPVEKPKRNMNVYEKWTIIIAVISIIVTIILKVLDYI